MAVHGPVADVNVGAIHRIGQRGTRGNLLGPLHQVVQQRHLAVGQRQRHPRDGAVMARRVHLQHTARARRALLRHAAAAQDGAHTGHQFTGRKRLGYVIITAQLERQHAVNLVLARGQEQHRRLGGRAQFAAHGQPVHFGQTDVQNDQIKPPRPPLCQPFGPVARGLGAVSGLLQRNAQHVTDLRIIVDDQNGFGTHGVVNCLVSIACKLRRSRALRKPHSRQSSG